VSYPNSGFYDITLIVNHGGQFDTLTKVKYIHVLHSAGIQCDPELSCSIFPCPNRGSFILHVQHLVNSTVDVSVADISGKTVYRVNGVRVNGMLDKKFNLSLPAGNYYVFVYDGNRSTMQKIIIVE